MSKLPVIYEERPLKERRSQKERCSDLERVSGLDGECRNSLERLFKEGSLVKTQVEPKAVEELRLPTAERRLPQPRRVAKDGRFLTLPEGEVMFQLPLQQYPLEGLLELTRVELPQWALLFGLRNLSPEQQLFDLLNLFDYNHLLSAEERGLIKVKRLPALLHLHFSGLLPKAERLINLVRVEAQLNESQVQLPRLSLLNTTGLNPGEIENIDRGEIGVRRELIRAALMRFTSPHLDIWHHQLVRRMFEEYDRLFCNGALTTLLKRRGMLLSTKVVFQTGRQSLEPAIKDDTLEIVLPYYLTLIDFCCEEDRNRSASRCVCGVEANDRLTAAQLVFEHQLAHAIVLLVRPNNWRTRQVTYDSHGSLFQEIVKGLFKHRSNQCVNLHSLNKGIKADRLGPNDFTIGARVSFFFRGRRIFGTVVYIATRSLTVQTPQGAGEVSYNLIELA